MNGLLDASQVASILGISAAWVRDHATRKEPRIAVVRIGRLLRFRLADVEAFIAENCS